MFVKNGDTMRLSTLFGRTLREAPGDVEGIGYQLVLRAGLARQMQAGSFALLPLGMAVLRRIEAIMHAELGAIEAQEFRTPVVQPAASWQRSGRYTDYGPLMLRFRDRAERELIVAPTHEEAVAELTAREIVSYRQMPQIIYQIHTKYRDEQRAKGGLMRMREFTMLDAYSMGASWQELDHSYAAIGAAFERIFERCGVRFIAVEASAGEMGGAEPREYMALSPSGEDILALCAACGYAANSEVAARGSERTAVPATVEPMTKIITPHASTIAELAAFLQISPTETAKAVFFDTPERGLVFAVVRGDAEVNELKLRTVIGVSALAPASLEQIAASGAVAGYASPVGLAVQHGSTASDGVLVVADQAVVHGRSFVAGANQVGFHLRNVLYGRDWQATLVADIASVQSGDACPRCAAPLALENGVEIGHIFKLGTRFSQALDARFLDAAGSEQPVVMGSYGIGLERLLQIIVEQHHDEHGIIWPHAVAPIDVHLVQLGKSEPVVTHAKRIYTQLQQAGITTLYDDRDETAGVKFNDADLIGLPLRILVSERLLKQGHLELKLRGGEAQSVAFDMYLAMVAALLT